MHLHPWFESPLSSNVSIMWGARAHPSQNGGPLVNSCPPLRFPWIPPGVGGSARPNSVPRSGRAEGGTSDERLEAPRQSSVPLSPSPFLLHRLMVSASGHHAVATLGLRLVQRSVDALDERLRGVAVRRTLRDADAHRHPLTAERFGSHVC